MKKERLYFAWFDLFLGAANFFAGTRAFGEGRVGSAVCSVLVGALCVAYGISLLITNRNDGDRCA